MDLRGPRSRLPSSPLTIGRVTLGWSDEIDYRCARATRPIRPCGTTPLRRCDHARGRLGIGPWRSASSLCSKVAAALGIDGSELVEEVEQTQTQAAQPRRAAKGAEALVAGRPLKSGVGGYGALLAGADRVADAGVAERVACATWRNEWPFCGK